MAIRRAVLVPLVLVVALAGAFPAAAQGFNLRDLLTEFLREGITLAPPTGGFPSHEAHFIGDDSPQFLALQEFNASLANQLSSFPLASSAGGFSYKYDPALGVFTRATESFGPIYAERADTIGKGRFNIGLNYSHLSFDAFGKEKLRDGDVRLLFTHQDINRDGTTIQPFFEGDVITAKLFLKLESNITAFVMSYGVNESLDVGVAVPLVSVDLRAQTDASIERIASGPAAPAIHRFLNGGSTETFTQSGKASGVGDIVLRGKYRFFGNSQGGLALEANVRVPTGEERDLLGNGAVQVKGFLIGSARLGIFSPHVNAGYTWSDKPSSGRSIPDEIAYTGGFDIALNPRLTFAADVIGRTFRNTQVVSVVNRTFTANTNPAGPPTLVTAVFPVLVVEKGNSTSLLGSVGFKVNPFGNFLLTVNGLISLNKEGLRDSFTPLVALEYSF